MNSKQKKWLLRIIISGVIFIVLFIFEHLGMLESFSWYILLPIFLVPYLIIGYDVLLRAAKNISHGRVFDENFLMMIATFGAFFVQEYTEAVAVMLFYQVGELFQNIAVNKSRQSITAMMEIVPEYANIEEDGQLTKVDPDDVEIGTIITILPGERIPLDGEIVEGSSFIDTAALTGESVPRKADVGDTVISGCVNGSGTLKVKTTTEFDDSTVSRILELVENASSKKARTENFITRFAKYYTPIVTIGAVLLAVIPPLVTGGNWMMWLERACIFLVISCPCALVISVPLGFFGGIGAASKIGVLVKGSNFLEQAAELKTVVFDKTGTLTMGSFSVTKIYPAGAEATVLPTSKASDNEADTEALTATSLDESALLLLRIAAHVEGYSTHPIASSIRQAFESFSDLQIDLGAVNDVSEIAGRGIRARFGDQTILAGNEKLLNEEGIDFTPCEDIGTIVYLADADQKKYLGIFKDGYVRMDQAANLVVIKTAAGMAMAVAAALDHLNLEEIIGTIAGDDTIMCATSSNKEAELAIRKISAMLKT